MHSRQNLKHAQSISVQPVKKPVANQIVLAMLTSSTRGIPLALHPRPALRDRPVHQARPALDVGMALDLGRSEHEVFPTAKRARLQLVCVGSVWLTHSWFSKRTDVFVERPTAHEHVVRPLEQEAERHDRKAK